MWNPISGHSREDAAYASTSVVLLQGRAEDEGGRSGSAVVQRVLDSAHALLGPRPHGRSRLPRLPRPTSGRSGSPFEQRNGYMAWSLYVRCGRRTSAWKHETLIPWLAPC